MQTTQTRDLQFIYDVTGFSDLAATLAEDQASDGAALEYLLAKQKLSLRIRPFWCVWSIFRQPITERSC